MISMLGFTVIVFIILQVAFRRMYFSEKWNENTYKTAIKSSYIVTAVLIAGTIIISCLWRVNPGEVGVIVNMFGSHRGVEDHELHVGYHFIKPWCTIYKFPIFEQNHQWANQDGFNFQTIEGLSVHADIGITFNLEPTHIHELFAKYRRGMDEIVHLFVRNNLRDAINKAAGKMRIEDLYGEKKEDFFINIQKQLKEELAPLGFNISHVYVIGQFHVPTSVTAALNAKIEAIQRAQQRENELRESEAEARKMVAKVEGEAQAKLLAAEAEAKANELLQKSLTKQMIEWEAIKKWNGKLPQIVGGKDIPFILNMKENK